MAKGKGKSRSSSEPDPVGAFPSSSAYVSGVAAQTNAASAWFTLLDSTNARAVAATTSLLFALLLRWTLSLWGHSGQDSPPLFGDFEAQRHWLEITTHVDIRMWYRYDLQYWGLDYPPLTAYHSWLLGWIAHKINPDWVALDTSRGNEADDLKMFMRYTAIMTDLVINMSAILAFAKPAINLEFQNTLIFVALIQPGLILIDHGHFQYNSAMLGFTLWFLVCMARGQYALGSVFFCLALGFKQMALYYSLPIFFYLLGVCGGLARRDSISTGIMELLKIGATVVITFGILFAPFLTRTDDLLQVIHRIFPVGRGLYEDKVANFWCAISVLVKVKTLFPTKTLVRISIAATLLAVLPTSIDLFLSQLKPQKLKPANPSRKLLLTLITGSLAFFLFSFQVHEKSILIPIMPATLLLLESDGVAWEGAWFITTAVFSMYPLLRRDGLSIPAVVLVGLFNVVYGGAVVFGRKARAGMLVRVVVGASYAFFATMVFCEEFVDAVPIPRYPDLYAVVNSFVSFGVFSLLYLRYSYVQLFEAEAILPGAAKKKRQ
ncbi:glycosyl transferase [Chytriomyces sp. MP71]|nr:glycosyl transferase [Chytriomyces sp. MP71]